MPPAAGTSLKPVRRMLAPKTLPKVEGGNFTRDLDLAQDELVALLELTQQVKASPARFSQSLKGQYLSLLFEKPSLRTRVTFELAIKQLGGDSVLTTGPIGDREPLKDVARNLDRWTNGIVARTFSQQTIDELAHWSELPVINALSDRYHPCQALADIFTLQEHFGDLAGLKLAFVGDGNNVAHSLMLSALRMGMNFSIATPHGYEPDAEIVAQAGQKGQITVATNMAGRGTDILLGRGVVELGGLFVLSTEPHTSGRVDRQLFGRAARQGDPGSAQMFACAEDDLFLRHAQHQRKFWRLIGANRLIKTAQNRAEHLARFNRKQVLKNDDWMDEALPF